MVQKGNMSSGPGPETESTLLRAKILNLFSMQHMNPCVICFILLENKHQDENMKFVFDLC